LAGLRRVIDEETVKKVLAVLSDECSEMPKNWNRRFKHNRDKIKTGDVYELAEVVRNLAIREAEKGLSTGEKQMFTRARKILASELMYALEMTEDEVEQHLNSLLLDSGHSNGAAKAAARSNGKVPVAAK
jgi:CarD family transcriptional regulator